MNRFPLRSVVPDVKEIPEQVANLLANADAEDFSGEVSDGLEYDSQDEFEVEGIQGINDAQLRTKFTCLIMASHCRSSRFTMFC